jgi:CRP/FNR family transcriptional regulator, cyclic AMP receptor protein
VFDTLQARAAQLLLGVAETAGHRPTAAVEIGLRLPQEQLGKLLGVSRQTAAGLVRDLVRDGLVRWRYGRVTLLDLPRLRALATDVVGAGA